MALDGPDDDGRHTARPDGVFALARRTPELLGLRRNRPNGIPGHGELTIELAASLAAHHAPVTAAERDELLALLEATDMPTDPIAELNVRG